MNDERQLPLIKRFMVRVAPEVVRHQYEIVDESEYIIRLDPEKIATTTLSIAMHLAAAYARCYDSLTTSEKIPPTHGQQKAPDPIKDLQPAPPGFSP